jgi:predicted metalloprotease with PDZ domain
MHKFHLDKSVLLCLAFAALANAAIAQQPESKNQDLKVTIIKKTIDSKGVETIEKIEQLPGQTPQNFEDNELIVENKAAMGVIISESEQGVKIDAVQGAAKEAGLLEGDIIVSFDGIVIKDVEQLQTTVKLHKIGDKVKVEYLRDGKKLNAELTLRAAERQIYLVEKRVDQSPRLHKKHQHDPCQKLTNLRSTPFLGVYINTESDIAKITDLIENTAAAKSKLKTGDVISMINDEQIGNYNELVSVLKQYKPGQIVKIGFERNGKTEMARIRLGSLADRDPVYTQKLEECCNAKSKNSNDEKADSPIIKNAEIIMELFPNPASQIINVNFNAVSNDPINISINNIEGKEMMRLEINANMEQISEQINIEKLPKGIYLMTIKQGKTVLSRQFSKI